MTSNNSMDNYEAEIVEDIPEQFDLNRYRGTSSAQKKIAPKIDQATILLAQQQQQQYIYASQQHQQYPIVYDTNYQRAPKQVQHQQQYPIYSTLTQTNNFYHAQQQHPQTYVQMQKIVYNQQQPQPHYKRSSKEFYKDDSTYSGSLKPARKERSASVSVTPTLVSNESPILSNLSKSKSNSSIDSEVSGIFEKEDVIEMSRESVSTLKEDSKKILKPASSGKGVKFDDKLDVYELKNPHYGVEIKTEKRAAKKKKKHRLKEEEIVLKTKLDMKSKMQTLRTHYFYYFENNLIFNVLMIYEENYYKSSLLKLQEKMRTSKMDEKARDSFLQSIERDNQITVDIINAMRQQFTSKLQPYCLQFQCTVDTLHTFPGMIQTMHSIANSINYQDTINSCLGEKEGSSLSLSKILGHDSRVDRFSKLQDTSQIVAPIKRKADIIPNKYVLSAIDAHVKEVSYAHYKNLTELVFQLKDICENDIHLARALFKYVLITQLEGLRKFEIGSYIMRNFDVGLESANTIFSRLCSFAGIENKCIRGYWKNISHEPGEKIDVKCLWNVLNLKSGWRFLQPAFTPVKYYLKPDIRYEETEFYFLSDPEYIYYEFLPMEKSWIFVETPLTLKEFERKPLVTPQFRTLNLSILQQESNIYTHVEKEPFKLMIKYPHELADMINFRYLLRYAAGSSKQALSSLNESSSAGPYYNQYVLAENISNEDVIVFKIASLPEIGHYNLTVYAEKDEVPVEDGQYPMNRSSTNQEGIKAIATFKITCSKVTQFEVPPNHIQNEIDIFGMNILMKHLGLVCCDFNRGVLGTDREGKVNLVFEMQQPIDLECYLYSSDPSIGAKFLELCILKRVVHNFVIIIIYPPHAGLYGLDLHGAPKGTLNSLLYSQLPPIGKYLLKSHHQVRSVTQFPKGDNRSWGPKQRFYDLGLHTVANIDPYLINEDGKQIEIEIAMLKPVTMWYKFDFDLNGTIKPIDNFCFMNYKSSSKRDKTVSFLLRFPTRGFYHLAIMATEIYPVKPDEIVFNYLIRVHDPSNEVERFPMILNPILWRECSLVTPKNYRLNNYDIHFSLIVPNTNRVQISTDDSVIEQLERREIENSWVGLVNLYQYDARFIYVEVEYDGKFHKLIRYKGPNYSDKD